MAERTPAAQEEGTVEEEVLFQRISEEIVRAAGRPNRVVLLRCDLDGGAARSLRVRVVGEAPATDALGARVTVEVGDRTQVQWVRTGSGYLMQSELTLTFGLGDAPRPARVSVRWPDGRERVFEDVGPGTLEARLE